MQIFRKADRLVLSNHIHSCDKWNWNAVAVGAGAILFVDAEGSLPNFESLPPRNVHGIASKLMLALLFIHVAAALHHHFIRRDTTLIKMLFKRD